MINNLMLIKWLALWETCCIDLIKVGSHNIGGEAQPREREARTTRSRAHGTGCSKNKIIIM